MMPAYTAGLTAMLAFAAFLAAHHLGDLWVQTHHQATHKGNPGRGGRLACAAHVATYTTTTSLFVLGIVALPLGTAASWQGFVAGQAFSAATHYSIDRRWTLLWLAARIGKRDLHDLGQPRAGYTVLAQHTVPVHTGGGTTVKGETCMVPLDQPTMGTGAYSLDQALHVAALFVSALLTALI